MTGKTAMSAQPLLLRNRRAGSRTGPIYVTAGVVLVAVSRNLLTLRWPADAAAIRALGYGALLLVGVATGRSVGLSGRDLGLFSGHHMLRLSGALFLTGVLAAPGCGRGVSPLLVLTAFPGAVIVASVEEVLFRGVLFALIRRHWGAGGAVLLTSGAFSLAHLGLYPPPVLLLGLIAGLLLGSWRALTGDLVAPVVAHSVADAVASGALGGLP